MDPNRSILNRSSSYKDLRSERWDRFYPLTISLNEPKDCLLSFKPPCVGLWKLFCVVTLIFSFLIVKTKSSCVSQFSTDTSVCILTTTQQVICWGLNNNGQLGYGDVSDRGDGSFELGEYLGFVDIDASAISVHTGSFHTCVHTTTLEVKCWGDGSYGQLGYGDTQDRGDGANEMGEYLPTINFGSSVFVNQILAGNTHNLILTDSGQIKTWGRNNYGQLGYGDTNNRGDLANQMSDYLPFFESWNWTNSI